MRDAGNLKTKQASQVSKGSIRSNINVYLDLANHTFTFNAKDWLTNTDGYDTVFESSRKGYAWVFLWLSIALCVGLLAGCSPGSDPLNTITIIC